MQDFTNNVIQNRRKELDQGGSESEPRTDILSRFMSLREENGDALPDAELRDVVLNFILAGRDTTSNALTWVNRH